MTIIDFKDLLLKEINLKQFKTKLVHIDNVEASLKRIIHLTINRVNKSRSFTFVDDIGLFKNKSNQYF